VSEFQRVVANVKRQWQDAQTEAERSQVRQRAVRALVGAGFDTEIHSSDGGRTQRTKEIKFITARDLALESHEKTEWSVEGFAAKGAVTMLFGKPKVGKTTFALGMCKSLVAGDRFLERPVIRSGFVSVVEQPRASYFQALELAGLLERDDAVFLFWTDVIGVSWSKIAKAATEECLRRGHDVLLIDTLHQVAGLVGDKENNAGDCLSAVQPLQEAAAAGLTVLFTWHERKGGGEISDAGRGSSAVAGAVDTILQIQGMGGNHRPTLRKIQSLSRFAETPKDLVVELEGQLWVPRGTTTALAKKEARERILDLLPSNEEAAPDFDQVFESLDGAVGKTLTRETLKELSDGGAVKRIGAGKKGDKYRYYATVRPVESAEVAVV